MRALHISESRSAHYRAMMARRYWCRRVLSYELLVQDSHAEARRHAEYCASSKSRYRFAVIARALGHAFQRFFHAAAGPRIKDADFSTPENARESDRGAAAPARHIF